MVSVGVVVVGVGRDEVVGVGMGVGRGGRVGGGKDGRGRGWQGWVVVGVYLHLLHLKCVHRQTMHIFVNFD